MTKTNKDSSFIPYNKNLKEYARQNRKNPTIAEQKIWKILRREQFASLKFTRQKPLERFIADFYCPKLLLVIEIDGESHTRQEKYDSLRSDVLKERFGIEVIRYTNTDVLSNIEGIYEDLAKNIKKRLVELSP